MMVGGMQKKGKDVMMSGYHKQQYYLTFCCCCSADGCILIQDWRRRNAKQCNDEAGNVIMWVHFRIGRITYTSCLVYNGMGERRRNVRML